MSADSVAAFNWMFHAAKDPEDCVGKAAEVVEAKSL